MITYNCSATNLVKENKPEGKSIKGVSSFYFLDRKTLDFIINSPLVSPS